MALFPYHLALRPAHRPVLLRLKRSAPALAFLGGFAFDALTLGRRVRPGDFIQLGLMLALSAVIIYWLARRAYLAVPPPIPGDNLAARLRQWRWQAPYLLVQFLFGGLFSALFILYFKSAGHLGTFLTALLLGALLVANEFIGRRYGQRFTLTWGLFGLNAILLLNFALPHLAGSLHPAWFYLSTASGALLTWGLQRLSPGRPGHSLLAWLVAAALLLAWRMDMIAPVPLVQRDIAIGRQFAIAGGDYRLLVEDAPFWQPWRDLARTVHLVRGERLYGVSAVFAPLGVSAPLEHRWQRLQADGQWQTVSTIRFQASGGREQGFRGHSWVLDPAVGDWRLLVGTQDGRTIGLFPFTVENAEAAPERLSWRAY